MKILEIQRLKLDLNILKNEGFYFKKTIILYITMNIELYLQKLSNLTFTPFLSIDYNRSPDFAYYPSKSD